MQEVYLMLSDYVIEHVKKDKACKLELRVVNDIIIKLREKALSKKKKYYPKLPPLRTIKKSWLLLIELGLVTFYEEKPTSIRIQYVLPNKNVIDKLLSINCEEDPYLIEYSKQMAIKSVDKVYYDFLSSEDKEVLINIKTEAMYDRLVKILKSSKYSLLV